jgi:hypothetical protein
LCVCRRTFASFVKTRSPCGCFAESLALALAVYGRCLCKSQGDRTAKN